MIIISIRHDLKLSGLLFYPITGILRAVGLKEAFVNRQKLTAAADSLMLTASMSVPAMPAPATIFAQDFEETSTEPQDPAVSSDQPIDDEDAEMAAYMQENGIDPQSDITGDEDIVIDLNNSLSSDMTATVYPRASETAVMDETGKTGSVSADLKLDEVLENVPTIFDKQIGWWKNSRLWPLQSKVGDTVENGLPIDLTLKVPVGVTINDAPVITDNTSGVDYSCSDNSSKNLFSEQTVTVTDPQTAQIHLRID